MILKMVKNAKKIFFKAVKIHPISKGLATPTNLSSTGTFEGCRLCDVLKGLFVEMYAGKPSFF